MTNNKNLVSVDNYKKPQSNFFILDLESKPQESLISLCQDEIEPSKVLKDPEKIALDIKKKEMGLQKKMSVDPDYAEIICVGIKRLGEEGKLYTPKEMEKLFKDNPQAIFIGFNSKNFDYPLLIKYGLKNNLDYPYKKLKDMCRKGNAPYSIDLQEVICPYGDFKKKDLLVEIYLGFKPETIDHSTATEDEIRIHCLSDLISEEGLYKKFEQVL